MNIKFQCAYFTTKCGVRPGEVTITAEEVMLDDINAKELLGQIDEREIFEYLNARGYNVQERAA
jgi:hypothetical protein